MYRDKIALVNDSSLRLCSSTFNGNFVSPAKKLAGCNLVIVFDPSENASATIQHIYSLQIPLVEEHTSTERTLYLTMPEEPDFFRGHGLLVQGAVRMYFLIKGRALPLSWCKNGIDCDVDIYIVNSCTLSERVFSECIFKSLTCCKDVTLGEEAFYKLDDHYPTLFFNGKVTGVVNAVAFRHCDAFIAIQDDETTIAKGMFNTDIRYLEYHGQWNNTTRDWVTGDISYLNGEPLDV